MKGIYPVQPKDPKKAGRGARIPKTYFRLKDIQFLAHEPILWKFRERKSHKKKMKKALYKREIKTLQQLVKNKPTYTLDHIVKERYPTFADALRDLDDPLTLCSSFAVLRKNHKIKGELVPLCRRLIIEFMNYVIASRSLRKVFLSIKGIYFQAEIQGQQITWLTPYKLGYQVPKKLDLKIISTFTEFYTTLLGFVNFRLYHSMNILYPPKLFLSSSSTENRDDTSFCLDDEDVSERVASLAHDLIKEKSTVNAEAADEEESRTKEDEELIAGANVDTEEYKKAKEEEAKLNKFKKLFENCKFFLSREVPREALTFVIRSFGGKVSWDKLLFIGATYDENDESITHQIVDRPQQARQHLSRYYIQPQWVFDCVNAQILLPVENYFPGEELPPHLSPFVREKEGDYVPPEKVALLERLEGIKKSDLQASGSQDDEEEEDIIDDVGDDVEEFEAFDEEDLEGESQLMQAEEKRLQQMKEETEKTETGDGSVKKARKRKRKKKSLHVTPGEIIKTDEKEEARLEASQEMKLREMMIPKKKKYIYKKIRQKEQARAKRHKRLTTKREKYEEEQRMKKAEKIQE